MLLCFLPGPCISLVSCGRLAAHKSLTGGMAQVSEWGWEKFWRKGCGRRIACWRCLVYGRWFEAREDVEFKLKRRLCASCGSAHLGRNLVKKRPTALQHRALLRASSCRKKRLFRLLSIDNAPINYGHASQESR